MTLRKPIQLVCQVFAPIVGLVIIVLLQMVFNNVLASKMDESKDIVLPRYFYASNLINTKTFDLLTKIGNLNNEVNRDKLFLRFNIHTGPRKNRYTFDPSEIKKNEIQDFLKSTPSPFEYYRDPTFNKTRLKYPQWDYFELNSEDKKIEIFPEKKVIEEMNQKLIKELSILSKKSVDEIVVENDPAYDS